MPARTSPPHILVFDSGVGGLSITQAIVERHPHCSITYASDNAAFPYGTKPEEQLIERVDRVLHTLQETTHADIIVVACNTASTVALPKIRERFSIPIIGVVPAIKPAAQLSHSKIIGLLATPGTIARQYTKALIDEFAHDCTVISVGSSELVKLAERKLRGQEVTPNELEPIVNTFKQNVETNAANDQSQIIDTIVLACTHFPLLEKELRNILPDIHYWVDSSDAIARRVGYWLNELQLPLSSMETQASAPQYSSIFTARERTLTELGPALENRGLGDIHYKEIQ